MLQNNVESPLSADQSQDFEQQNAAQNTTNQIECHMQKLQESVKLLAHRTNAYSKSPFDHKTAFTSPTRMPMNTTITAT
jgi:hypothetical protein